jgi:cell wall-associated NlpC family hydrolase
VVFKCLGLSLPRDAWQQAEIGNVIDFVQSIQLGDLAFFNNEDGKIIHVGIVLKDNKIIHASGKVRIDTLDHFGIFQAETKKYSHQLKIIKRVL